MSTPTDKQVIAAFLDYFNERAAAGVLLGRAVEHVAFQNGTVTVTFNERRGDLAPGILWETSPFENHAEFAGIPIAFKDDAGRWLRQAVQRIVTVDRDGNPRGALTTAEIYQRSTLEEYQPGA